MMNRVVITGMGIYSCLGKTLDEAEIPLGSFVFSHISVGCDGLLNWYADRDKIALLDIEEAFKKHTGWNVHLPDPYFVKAGERMSELFRDCHLV